MEITKRTAFRLRRFLAKCPGYFGLGRNRATWTGAGMTLVTFRWLQPSLEMERSRRMVFGSRESGVSGAGWQRHRTEIQTGTLMDCFNSYICSFFFSVFSIRARRIDDTLGTGSILIACCIGYVMAEETEGLIKSITER
jgi:hypothetical protein